jgi:predicted small lipoprotein YifL
MSAARLCTLLGALLIGGGCGQKGALYLPDPAPHAVPAPPASATPAATPAADEAATPADDEAARRKTPSAPDPATTR